MPNTTSQKRLHIAKAFSKRELKLKQREGELEQREGAAEVKKRALQAQEQLLEERRLHVEEQSRVAEAMARLGFDPGPMPTWVAEKAWGALSARPKNSR
jgi:hypothetical protein